MPRIHRKYIYLGSGFEDEDPCSCTYFDLALDFEEEGNGEAAEEMLAAAVADEDYVCGRPRCPHCNVS